MSKLWMCMHVGALACLQTLVLSLGLFILLIFEILILISFCCINFDFVLCFMIDCLPLWFPWLPKIIKISIHQLRTHECAKEYVLQGEILQTGNILWACSILISGGRMYIWGCGKCLLWSKSAYEATSIVHDTPSSAFLWASQEDGDLLTT